MRDGHEPLFSRVPEMMVTARDADELPAIRLNQFDDLGTVHTSYPPSYTHIHNLTSGEFSLSMRGGVEAAAPANPRAKSSFQRDEVD